MENLIPFNSLLMRDIFSVAEMRCIWTEENLIKKWIEVEKAIAETQAELGMIPQNAAQKILENLSIEKLTIKKIYQKKQTVGHLMVAFLKAFRDVCGSAAEHLHLGATTQDILDTGLILQMKEAYKCICVKMLELENILCDQAIKYKKTIMMGRTHQQHAVPTTFGFILAVWANELYDHIERARGSEKRWLIGSISGVVGTQNSFVELSDEDTARKLQEMVCQKLKLASPLISLHSRTDRFSEVTCIIAELLSSLGRIGLNLRDWQRTEVFEIEEPYLDTQHSSSTLPNKKNPEASEIVEGLATVARSLALATQDIQMSLTRDSVRIPVLYICIPVSFMLASKALEITINNIKGLIVHPKNMLKNIDHPNYFQQAAAERIMLAMYRKTGRKDMAHTLLHKCARQSYKEKVSFSKVLLSDKKIGSFFTKEELDKLTDLKTYIGTAVQQTESTVQAIRKKRNLKATVSI